MSGKPKNTILPLGLVIARACWIVSALPTASMTMSAPWPAVTSITASLTASPSVSPLTDMSAPKVEDWASLAGDKSATITFSAPRCFACQAKNCPAEPCPKTATVFPTKSMLPLRSAYMVVPNCCAIKRSSIEPSYFGRGRHHPPGSV